MRLDREIDESMLMDVFYGIFNGIHHPVIRHGNEESFVMVVTNSLL